MITTLTSSELFCLVNVNLARPIARAIKKAEVRALGIIVAIHIVMGNKGEEKLNFLTPYSPLTNP